MKLCRFDGDRIGIVRGAHVHDVTAILEELPQARYPFPVGDLLIAHLPRLRGRIEDLADRAEGIPIGDLRLRSPVANPSKIIGTPTNYKAHSEEAALDPAISAYGVQGRSIEEQGLFLKAVSALVGPAEGVTLRFPDRRTDHEAEIGVVIGRRASNIAEADALSHVAGYAIALDMVVRGPEDRSFRKSPDSYAVLGPWLVTADEIADPGALDFSLTVNGESRQVANSRDMIIDIPRQIAWASSFYTLHPGDIIMTGTCQGVGPVVGGDVMRVECQGLGAMDVPVHAAAG
jgi:2-keto-4-pentenoate hydratase/2-oxohepta-3-ene-1,7-dioic acid hydratase in catechol pathway